MTEWMGYPQPMGAHPERPWWRWSDRATMGDYVRTDGLAAQALAWRSEEAHIRVWRPGMEHHFQGPEWAGPWAPCSSRVQDRRGRLDVAIATSIDA